MYWAEFNHNDIVRESYQETEMNRLVFYHGGNITATSYRLRVHMLLNTARKITIHI